MGRGIKTWLVIGPILMKDRLVLPRWECGQGRRVEGWKEHGRGGRGAMRTERRKEPVEGPSARAPCRSGNGAIGSPSLSANPPRLGPAFEKDPSKLTAGHASQARFRRERRPRKQLTFCAKNFTASFSFFPSIPGRGHRPTRRRRLVFLFYFLSSVV